MSPPGSEKSDLVRPLLCCRHLNANDLNGTLPEEWSTLVNLTSLCVLPVSKIGTGKRSRLERGVEIQRKGIAGIRNP